MKQQVLFKVSQPTHAIQYAGTKRLAYRGCLLAALSFERYRIIEAPIAWLVGRAGQLETVCVLIDATADFR